MILVIIITVRMIIAIMIKTAITTTHDNIINTMRIIK